MSIRRYVTTDVDPRTRGEGIGRFGADEIAANVADYARLFRAAGVDDDGMRAFSTRAEDALAAWSPEQHRELRGVAVGAGVSSWQVAMLNARTEILAAVGAVGEGECSTAVCLPDGAAPRTVQTWDWHDELDTDNLVVRYRAEGGHTVRYFTEFGMLAKIGLNSAGLGVHFNILNHASDNDLIGVPVHVVARQLLDSATSVAEAVEIASSAPVSASTVLTVAAYDGTRGDAACIELSPSGTAVVRPRDGLLVHTNHFLDEDLARGDLALATASTHRRAKQLRAFKDRFADPAPISRARALAVHEADGAPVCCHPDPTQPFDKRWQSLLTIVLDLERSTLQFHDGCPCGVRPQTWQIF